MEDRKSKMKGLNFFCIAFLGLAIGLSACEKSTVDSLDNLDRIIADRHSFEEVRREKIDSIKNDYRSAKTDSDRYNVLRGLYQEYRTFRIDSSLIIADERLALARKLGNPSRIASASINLAESYVKSGLPDEAINILDTLDSSMLEEYHKKYRNSVLRNAYSFKSKTSLLPSDRVEAVEKVRILREETLSENAKDSKGYYMLTAEKLMEMGLYKEAVAKMEEAAGKFDFSNDAALQYSMGEIYLGAGRSREAIDCLAASAALDISSGVKEYRALILLASLLFEKGDINRAFKYINIAFDDAHFSNANLRTPEIMENMPVINQAFRAYEQKESRKTIVWFWIAVLFVVVLLVLSFLLWRTLWANRKMLSTIAKINAELEKRNNELVEADRLKLQNINILMLSHARYISRLKDFRKNIYRLLVAGQREKALERVKSDNVETREISTFYELFDETVFSMFPDFIQSVNGLLEKPISLKEEGRLTPELRVMALMRLGLSSTEEISGILQYSAQTVYNLRSTIRSMTNLSKEEFEVKIKEI